jgi:copper chaperone CopZ
VTGVRQVQINMADKSVRVEHDGSATISDLIEAIKEAGYFEVSVLA